MRLFFGLILALCYCGSAVAIELPPVNPYLADSAWPMSHSHPYSQASVGHAGPTTASNSVVDFKALPAGIVTLCLDRTDGQGRAVVWASSLLGIHKLLRTDNQLLLVDSLPLWTLSKAGALSGAYTLVDHEGRFFVPRGQSLYAFMGVDAGDPSSKIKQHAHIDLTSRHIMQPDDAIVGLNISFDGYLVFVTMHGVVGVISRDFASLHHLQLPAGESVSNSIAVDEDGGIFVVTSKMMRRLQWTGARLTADPTAGAWAAPYDTGDDLTIPGRLGKGSGTTPTLIGNQGEDQLVVIADGARLMKLVFFWRNAIPPAAQAKVPGVPRIADQIPIRFGNANATLSTTEQSVLAHGYDTLVVNNDYGWLKKFPLQLGQAAVVFTNLPGVAPRGVEKFRWDPQAQRIVRVWANPDLSCPNGIPSYSAVSNLAYCIGQRRGRWTLEGIDWDTGASRFHQVLGLRPRYNSAYAATQVAGEGMILSGALGGVYSITAKD